MEYNNYDFKENFLEKENNNKKMPPALSKFKNTTNLNNSNLILSVLL